MNESLDAVTRTVDVAQGIDAWALAILLIGALAVTVVMLARRIDKLLTHQVTANMETGTALHRSADAHERTSAALTEMQKAIELLRQEQRDLRMEVKS